jgi:hypothetical protein
MDKLKPQSWTSAEVELLAESADLSNTELSELMGRTVNEVRWCRKKLGYKFSGDRSSSMKKVREEYGNIVRDSRGPDCKCVSSNRSPCCECWNRDGDKNRYGCLQCDERMKYDAALSCAEVFPTFDYTPNAIHYGSIRKTQMSFIH